MKSTRIATFVVVLWSGEVIIAKVEEAPSSFLQYFNGRADVTNSLINLKKSLS